MAQKTYLALDSINKLLSQIKADIEAAASTGSTGSGAAYDDTLIQSRLKELEKYVNDLNPWGEYEWISQDINQTSISSQVSVIGTQFYQEYLDDENAFWDTLEADKYELYIPRQADGMKGYNRYDTLLPWEGSSKSPGSELSKVCKYNDIDTWNWNYGGLEYIELSTSGDSNYTFVIIKRK